VASKVLLKLLGGIFSEHLKKIKNVDKIKNVKNVKNVFLHLCCILEVLMLSAVDGQPSGATFSKLRKFFS